MKTASLILTALLASVLGLHAQNRAGTAINTFERNQERAQFQTDSSISSFRSGEEAPSLFPGEMQDTGPQFILKPKVRRTWVRATVDSQLMYTDNMFFTEQNKVDTAIWINTGEFAVAPSAFEVWGGQLSPQIGFREQVYFYGILEPENRQSAYNNFDFQAQTVFMDVRYMFLETWQARVGADLTRFISTDDSTNEFYREAVPRWGMDKFFPINDQNLVYLNYDGNYRVTYTDPLPRSNFNDRSEQAFTLGYVWNPVERFTIRPYYRFMYTYYINNQVNGRGREDTLNTVGLYLNYDITDWASVRTYVTYDMRDTDNPIFQDYDVFNSGVGATLNVKF